MLKTIKNTGLLIVGTISLVLGIIGVILPLVPGTPFLILAFFCYAALIESILVEVWF